MNQTRYCSTCGTLLSEGAAICGECGARYQASPYERRATDSPGAWSQAPIPRSRDLGAEPADDSAEEGVELISPQSLEPRAPGATTLRSGEQYDQMMVTPPPMPQHAPGSASGMPSGPGSPAAAVAAPPAGGQLEPPLDGCAPASPAKRFLAALVDSVLATLVLAPFLIGIVLVVNGGADALLPYILIGAGVALPAAYTVLIIWLTGAKGFTVGKLILGLRITRVSEGGPIGFVRALGRWILYGIIPLIMALSIFLDPEKHLRGFHDRAVDSVVVDIATGRNPMKPRPDDFERASAEHYLGAPSVAVSAHENLLTEPGAAWQSASAAQPQPAVSTGGWGEAAQGAPSPYAPSAPEAPAAAQPAADTGWAPPSTEPVAPEQSWGQQAAEPQQSWGQPGAEPQRSWDRPAAEPPQSWQPPNAEPAPSWEQPVAQPPSAAQPAQQDWSQPQQPSQAVQQDWSQPWPPAQSGWSGAAQEPHGAPSDLTGDAWSAGDDGGVDEQTRLTAADEPLGDLEQTRISAAQLPPVTTLRLTTDDGAERLVERAVVVGRNPAAPADELLFVMKDDTRSVSKTHLRIDGTGEEVTVTDLGSTNGSSILRQDGSRESLVPHTPTVLPEGARVTMGDRTVSVEKVQ